MTHTSYDDPRLAALYDPLYDTVGFTARGPDGAHPPDVAFYLQRLGPPPAAVLELGCGTGRVSIPLAVAGHRVTGLDGSPAMLDVARAKAACLPVETAGRLAWVEADWHDYDLGAGTFDACLCPFSAFQTNLTIADQDRFLSLAREHLRPGGLLLVGLFFPNLLRLGSGDEPRHPNRSFVVDGVAWVEHETIIRHSAEQWFECCLDYQRADGTGEVIENRFRLTWFLPRELARMTAANGLELVGVLDGYSGRPVRDDSLRQVLVARRPAE